MRPFEQKINVQNVGFSDLLSERSFTLEIRRENWGRRPGIKEDTMAEFARWEPQTVEGKLVFPHQLTPGEVFDNDIFIGPPSGSRRLRSIRGILKEPTLLVGGTNALSLNTRKPASSAAALRTWLLRIPMKKCGREQRNVLSWLFRVPEVIDKRYLSSIRRLSNFKNKTPWIGAFFLRRNLALDARPWPWPGGRLRGEKLNI